MASLAIPQRSPLRPSPSQNAPPPHDQTHTKDLNNLSGTPLPLVATPPPAYADSVPSLQISSPSQPPKARLSPPVRAPPPPPRQRWTSLLASALLPPRSVPEEPSNMVPTAYQPQPQRSEVLRKTRSPHRDDGQQLEHHVYYERPLAAQQNAVSVTLPLHNGPRRDLSPAGLEHRGRSTSAHPLPSSTTAPSLLYPPNQGRHTATVPGHSSRAVSQHSNEEHRAYEDHRVDEDHRVYEDHRDYSPGRADENQERRSWLSGGNSRLRSKSHSPSAGSKYQAWILSSESRADYNVDCLINCERVHELWDDNGTLYVYLSSYQSGKGPSFKVHPDIIKQSRVLSGRVQSQQSSPASARSRARSFGGRDSLMAADAHRAAQPASPPLFTGHEAHLHLPAEPLANEDAVPEFNRLIVLRNLFALLTGQPLVFTRTFPTAFDSLYQVARLMLDFEFGVTSSGSGSFGEVADRSIGFYVDQTGLADVRFNRDKIIEALVLGEQLRFWPLYNEAFCHAVGKCKYPAREITIWGLLSPSTRQRLERAHLDLLTRQHSVNTRLEQFEFPSLFSGVANSTSNPDYRNIRFKNWRSSFANLRSFTLKYYKAQLGSWPPKASSKRNPFSESGLNRLVLKMLYADLCSVYDLLVDRGSMTTRVGEDGRVSGVSDAPATGSAHRHVSDPTMIALRQILAEFDTSSPPVLPPIPFDVPKLPSMTAIHETFPTMTPKDQARFEKKIQPKELQLILLRSHNADAERAAESPFLAAFESFEHYEAKGKSETELAEMRIGHWLFLYVVLQSVPMLVIDAPGLRFSEGVEYFLCEPPQGRPPWVEDAGDVRKAWFQTAGGAGPLVELSADVLLYSVEATYHRSHCWLAAKMWDTGVGSRDDLVAAYGMERGADATAASGMLFSTRTAAPTDLHVGLGMDMYAHAPARVHGHHDTVTRSVSPLTVPSPRARPALDDETGPSPRATPPMAAAQRPGQYSPAQLPQRHQLEELPPRADLRHASSGWKLEPVHLATDDSQMLMRPGNDSMTAGRDSRRVVSANNLRAMGEPAGVSSRASISTTSTGTGTTAAGEFFNAESTFDQILSSMDDGRKKKKRSSFLPF